MLQATVAPKYRSAIGIFSLYSTNDTAQNKYVQFSIKLHEMKNENVLLIIYEIVNFHEELNT